MSVKKYITLVLAILTLGTSTASISQNSIYPPLKEKKKLVDRYKYIEEYNVNRKTRSWGAKRGPEYADPDEFKQNPWILEKNNVEPFLQDNPWQYVPDMYTSPYRRNGQHRSLRGAPKKEK